MIRQQNEFLNAILESLTYPFYVIDANDHSIVMANSAAGLQPSTQKTCYAATHKRDEPCPADECPLEIVKKTREPAQMEHVHYDREGNPRIFQVYGYPMFDQEGNVSQMIEYSLDITQRKAAEQALKEYSQRLEEMVDERTQELRDAQAELLRQEKLAVLGKLSGGVAHELRNPLGAIKNSVYFLNMVLQDVEPEAQEALEIIDKEINTCERIISSLLNFARTQSPVQRYTNLHAIVQAVLSRIAIPENVELAYSADDDLPLVLTDPEQLDMALGNIVHNAVQAMPEGGRLSATVEALDAQWAAVSVGDTGAGISQDNLQQIFEPFFTTRARGIGLGLALAKDLVEVNGGSIEVQSQLGQGSVFTVRLPLAW